MEIAEFLLARIAEDEAKVADPPEFDQPQNDMRIEWAEVGAISEVLMIGEARLRAECEAKRQIIDLAGAASGDHYGIIAEFAVFDHEIEEAQRNDPGLLILQQLAVPYADHPDYREEWRP